MLEKYINVAAGREKADIVLKNASYVNVFSGTVERGDIAIAADKIAGIGAYSGKEEIDVTGFCVLPGLIDGHVHIESSQLSPEQFAALVVPRGTTAVIADPHEITNVCGMAGAEYIAAASRGVPLDVRVMLPSCVPATLFENSGAVLGAEEIQNNISNGYICGLGEFMNYPAVTSCDGEAIKKLEAALNSDKIIDGHAPALTGEALNAYICGGIATDHECASPEEAAEKAAKGMYVHLRHGSTARNLVPNSKAVTAANMRRFIICTDDRHADDLSEKGHIDDALRTLVASGFDPVQAVTMATLNAAECYSLKDRGAIAPFKAADLVVVDNLKNFNAKYVFKDGKLVAKDGEPLFDTSARHIPDCVKNTVHIGKIAADDFKIALRSRRANVITLNAGSIVTGCEVADINSAGGDIVLKDGLLKLAVVERHKNTGNIGKGIIKGYGFKGGAMGITVSHDSHNIILLGDDNQSMANAARELARIGGGMVIADRAENKIYSMPLDIGGLMSSRDAKSFQRESKALAERAYAMGVNRSLDAFMTLAFLSLAVVPHVKLLDTGLFDADNFKFMDINAD